MDAQTWEMLKIIGVVCVAVAVVVISVIVDMRIQNRNYMQGYLDGLKAERQSNEQRKRKVKGQAK